MESNESDEKFDLLVGGQMGIASDVIDSDEHFRTNCARDFLVDRRIAELDLVSQIAAKSRFG